MALIPWDKLREDTLAERDALDARWNAAAKRTASDQAAIDAAQADMDRKAASMAVWRAEGDAARAAAGGSSQPGNTDLCSGRYQSQRMGDTW